MASPSPAKGDNNTNIASPSPATGNNNNTKLHIAMLPWLAFGHMIPYLQLAKLMAEKGHKISFISTPKNVDRLPKIPSHLVSSLNFVKIPLPRNQNLPENAEATTDLPYDKVQYLKIAYDDMKDSVEEFLREEKPDWIFYDFAPYWVAPIAAKLHISSAHYSIIIAACIGFLGPSTFLMYGGDDRIPPDGFTVPPKWVTFQTTVAYRVYEVMKIMDSFTGNDSAASDLYRFGASFQGCDLLAIRSVIFNLSMMDSFTGNDSVASDLYRFGASFEGCDLLAIRSCSEFEPQWLKLVEELHQKPVLPVGQLPPTVFDSGVKDNDETWLTTKSWLDKQMKSSVVYIAFGSEAKPSQDELTEIALGLELSGLPFFWVLRTKRGSTDTDSIELPNGFEERTKERGIVCTSWAPQLKILSHDSVGGFLTHSGWSSVVEAVVLERALILLTFLADQGLNARVLEEKKMGYLIPRNELDGSFTRDSVAQSLRLVMVEEKGKVYRDKVKEMKGLFGDRDRQDKYVNNLLSLLWQHKKNVNKEN